MYGFEAGAHSGPRGHTGPPSLRVNLRFPPSVPGPDLTVGFSGPRGKVPVHLIRSAAVVAATAVLLVAAPAVAKPITGTNENDNLRGTLSDDTIDALYGDDVVHGRDGDDVIHGDGDSDTLYGDAGHDQLFGDYGNDVLYGGPSRDKLTDSEYGNDTFYGNGGRDKILVANGNDKVFGGAGDDVVWLFSDKYKDVVNCGDGTDEVIIFGVVEDYDQFTQCESVHRDGL